METKNETPETTAIDATKIEMPKTLSKQAVETVLASPQYTARLSGLLGSNKDATRFQMATLNALNKNQKLKDCTPASFFDTLNKCAEFKLFPDNRTCALVPTRNNGLNCTEAQFRLMYQGYVELFARNGITVKVSEVCENDFYEETNDKIIHTIDRLAEFKGQRGAIYGFVIHATMPDGRVKSEFISLKYLDKVRRISKMQNMWEKEFVEMAKKTAIRYLAKTLPQTSELQWAIAEDDKSGFDFDSKRNQPQNPNAFHINSDNVNTGKEE